MHYQLLIKPSKLYTIHLIKIKTLKYELPRRKNNTNEDPTTPITRISIHPKHNHVIHCAIGFKNPIDVATLKDELSNSIMTKIPRFSSLLVVDPYDGSEHWKKTHVNLDDHLFIDYHGNDDGGGAGGAGGGDDDDNLLMSNEDAINSYLADIAISPPMSMAKPLWEVHILHKYNCMIFRVHHAVADGMVLMSLLWTMGNNSSCVKNNVHDNKVISNKNNEHVTRVKNSRSKNMGLLRKLMLIWFVLVALLKYIMRCVWVKDKESVISGIEGVEFWPRKVKTAKFKISDMKAVKNVIPNATINDVLYGTLWCGLTRYLQARHPQTLKDGLQITGLCPINIRKQRGLQDLSTIVSSPDKTRDVWGNKFSMVLLPISCYKRDWHPLTYTARAKAIVDRKKESMEAQLIYHLGSLVFALLGSKIGGDLFYNLFSNTSFLVSNMLGPQEQISIAGNPVSFIRVTSSGQPHAFTMHMVSYAGNADLQVQVAKEVIPDPECLVKCFEDALHEMKEAVDKCACNYN